ncbi:MAG: phosphatidylglycerophosphatase A [Proteobacteria bacterium]|nr:phosphatidylglycerophosphatase A [Pseudomonadota bacterium]
MTAFFATGCFAGRIPLAPGTWGTVVGLGLYWLVRYLPPLSYAIFTVTFVVFAIWIATRAQSIFEETDPPQVVIDEIAGYLVTMAFHRPSFALAVVGFVLFRIFDIVKPPPIRWIERRFSDGRGVVLDDVMAGLYASVSLLALEFVLPALGIQGITWW